MKHRSLLAFPILAATLAVGVESHAQMTPMTTAAAASPPQTNATPKPATPALPPPIPEADYQRYGKIISAGTEPSHPLKLSMPFPDIGQFKIPSADELAMRAKLERLITMSDADIRQNLANWPAFAKMSLADEGNMLLRIQMFKDRRAKVAQDRAHALGLLTLKPDQFQRFETEYWNKRMQMDTELAHQFQPVYQARENKLEEELFREFSTPQAPVPAPKPPAATASSMPAAKPPPPLTGQNAVSTTTPMR